MAGEPPPMAAPQPARLPSLTGAFFSFLLFFFLSAAPRRPAAAKARNGGGAGRTSRWMAADGSKRWGETFFLLYTPFWLTLCLGVVVPFKLYEVATHPSIRSFLLFSLDTSESWASLGTPCWIFRIRFFEGRSDLGDFKMDIRSGDKNNIYFLLLCAEVHGAGVPSCWVGVHSACLRHPALPRRQGTFGSISPQNTSTLNWDLTDVIV